MGIIRTNGILPEGIPLRDRAMEDRLPYQTAALILVLYLDLTREAAALPLGTPLPLDTRRATLHPRGTIQGGQAQALAQVPGRVLGPDLGLLFEMTPIALSL